MSAGYLLKSFGAGVENFQVTAAFVAPPPSIDAARVPAGMLTVNSVAIGSRWPSGSNTSVFVPSQRQRPGGCGDIRTGTLRAASSCEVTATIGRENVTLNCGASGTSPRGEYRSTRSSPPASASGARRSSSDGNAFKTVAPARGGGSDLSRNANSLASASSVFKGGSRCNTRAVSASESFSARAGAGLGALAPDSSAPSLSRKLRPFRACASSAPSSSPSCWCSRC